MTSGSNSAIPPGPTGHWAFGNLGHFSEDPLAFLQDCVRKHGDVVKVAKRTYLLAAPAAISTVLGDDGALYGKVDSDPGVRRPAFPASVMNSTGAVWQHKRRALQPAFRATLVRDAATHALVATRSLLRERGESCAIQDMRALMTGLCAQLGAGFLLGDPAHAPDLLLMLPMVDAILQQTRRQSMAPLWWPSANRHRLRRARADLDMALDRILARSMQRPPHAASVLALLLAETAQGDGDWRRDEAAAILMSALEPMSAALTWTLLLLAQHPQIAQEVAQEANALDDADADAASGTSLLDWLPQTRACVKESLRLYPPAWITARIAQRDATLNGFHVPCGTQLLVSSWVVHRDGRYFSDPEIFLPARWLDDTATHSLARYSYFPFGGGSRSCIGSMLALTQMTVVIATILRTCTLHLAPDARPSPFPALVLRPLDVRIALRPRAIRSAAPAQAHAATAFFTPVSPDD